MEDKYFSELNGYLVKDKEGREYSHASIFLDNITVTTEYDETSKTEYYITEIPLHDSEGNQNQWKLGIPYDDLSLQSTEGTLDFAYSKVASVCINAGLGRLSQGVPIGILIKDGVILQNELYTTEDRKVLGIKENGDFVTFPSATTTAQDVLEAGCVNALLGFDTFIENGEASTYAPANGIETQPRQVIGRKSNGNYFIFTCNGREQDDVGMTVADMQRILLAKGDIDFAFNLDGGGSTSTVVNLQKINKDIDQHWKDRPVFDFLYMTKNITKKDIAEIYTLVSKLRQEMIEKLVNLAVLNDSIKIYSDSANTSQIEFYNNGERTIRSGRINLDLEGFNVRYRTSLEEEENNLFSVTNSYVRYKGIPFGEFMDYCTNVAAETNLDDITAQGFYMSSSSTIGVPDNNTYLIFHMNTGSSKSNKNQFAFPVNANKGYIYCRRKSGSSAWGDWFPLNVYNGSTAGRPTTHINTGCMYFDTTLGKPIWYDGTNWVDATGTTV